MKKLNAEAVMLLLLLAAAHLFFIISAAAFLEQLQEHDEQQALELSRRVESMSPDVIRIGVVDTGLDIKRLSRNAVMCPGYAYNAVADNDSINEQKDFSHGTEVVNIIANTLVDSNYCIYFVKIFDDNLFTSSHISKRSLSFLKNRNVNIVVMAQAGSSRFSEEEYLMKSMASEGVVFVVSAGNEGLQLQEPCGIYPACYKVKRMRIVAGLDYNGEIHVKSNRGSIITDAAPFCVEDFCGTSASAPLIVNKVVKELREKK